MTLGTILLIIALVCFVCAAIGKPDVRINLTATGLAFVTAATLIAGYVFA